MGLKRSLAELARSLYRFRWVRSVLLVAGPSRWRLPRTLRGRIESEAAVRRRYRRRLVRFGYEESVVPAGPPDPPPTMGHRIVAHPYRVSKPFACEIERVWLVGRHATPVTRDGRVLLTPYRNEPRMLALDEQADLEAFVASRSYEQAWPSDAVRGPLFSTVTRVDSNYAHWLLESCAQLEGVRAWSAASGVEVSVLVRADGRRFQRPSLARLGVGDALVDWNDHQPPLAVDRLVVTSIPGTPVAVSPRSVAWLRQALLGRPDPASAGASDRVYIARRQGGWRYVENHDAVEGALAARGFTILDAETLSFDEQVAVFRGADLVVAQHGSGLTNLLFAPSGGSVIELTGDYGDGYFYGLASARGQRYHALPCRTDGDAMTVDVAALVHLVDEVADS